MDALFSFLFKTALCIYGCRALLYWLFDSPDPTAYRPYMR